MRNVGRIGWAVASALIYAAGCAAAGCAGDESEPIETIFCNVDPGACQQRVIELIDSANSTLQCAVFSFTLEEVANALVRAKDRGVDVWVVTESSQLDTAVSDILENSGVFFRLDGNPRSMHHKFVVVDQQIVGSGSFNWTFFADTQNDENLMVFDSKDIASAFGHEFERVWEEAGP